MTKRSQEKGIKENQKQGDKRREKRKLSYWKVIKDQGRGNKEEEEKERRIKGIKEGKSYDNKKRKRWHKRERRKEEEEGEKEKIMEGKDLEMGK